MEEKNRGNDEKSKGNDENSRENEDITDFETYRNSTGEEKKKLFENMNRNNETGRTSSMEEMMARVHPAMSKERRFSPGKKGLEALDRFEERFDNWAEEQIKKKEAEGKGGNGIRESPVDFYYGFALKKQNHFSTYGNIGSYARGMLMFLEGGLRDICQLEYDPEEFCRELISSPKALWQMASSKETNMYQMNAAMTSAGMNVFAGVLGGVAGKARMSGEITAVGEMGTIERELGAAGRFGAVEKGAETAGKLGAVEKGAETAGKLGAVENRLGTAGKIGVLEGESALGLSGMTDDWLNAVNGLTDQMETLPDGPCFVAGTKVFTQRGPAAIETIKEGEAVWCEDAETGKQGLKKAEKKIVKESNVLYHVIVDSEEIVTTPQHPFWIEGKGWKTAESLLPGDKVRLKNRQQKQIWNIWMEKKAEPVLVYNLSVEDYHTYYVSEYGILVHNAWCSKGKVNILENVGESGMISKLIASADDIIKKAQAGKLKYHKKYHGRLGKSLEQEILSNPEAIYVTTNSKQNFVYRKGNNVVIVESRGSSKGNIITSYGPSGPRGESGAKIFGGTPNDPGMPVTHEDIMNGIKQPNGGTFPPAIQIK